MSYLASLQDFWTFSFLSWALLGTVIVSLSCGLLSPLIVAKRYAFIGSAISHSTLLGLSIAALIFERSSTLGFFLSTLFITLILTMILARATYDRALPSDSMIGIFFSVTMGLGILIHSTFTPNQTDLMSFLFGNILLVTPLDIYLGLIFLLMTIGALVWGFKKWIYDLYDPQGAALAGIPTKTLHLILFTLMTVVIVSSLKIAGTVLVNTLIIIPGVFALRVASSMKAAFFISALFSVVVSVVALTISNYLDLPSGATLAVVQFIALTFSVFFPKN